jgi:hypothetical protein
MYRKSLALMLVAAAWATLLVVSPAVAQRSRRPEPRPPEEAEPPQVRERPDAGPQAGEPDLRGRDSREGSEDGWPGGMQERAAAPGQARVFPGFTWPPQWWLGVYVYNTPTGVVITRVVPNSPAARAGLEPRDCIVAVEGYQWVMSTAACTPWGPNCNCGPVGTGKCSCWCRIGGTTN